MKKNIVIPEINSSFERIDTTVFEAEAKTHVEIIGNSYIDYTRGNIGFGKVIYTDDSNFKVIKSFYPNGNLRKKGVMFNNGANYGIWYHFDLEGNLVKEENTDEGYEFTWEQVIRYCQNNNIKLELGVPEDGGIKTEIFQNEEDNKKVWTISFFDLETNKYLELTLDGSKGSELKRRELEFIGN